MPAEAYSARQLVPAGDFQLRTLDEKIIRLADFRGKIVLISFWTTWCTACVSEMPELITLQKKHADNLVIVGVSLDYVHYEHGLIGDHAAEEEQKHIDGDHGDQAATIAALKRVRDKVARIVKARGINYPILLDEKNEVGGRFGELHPNPFADDGGAGGKPPAKCSTKGSTPSVSASCGSPCVLPNQSAGGGRAWGLGSGVSGLGWGRKNHG